MFHHVHCTRVQSSDAPYHSYLTTLYVVRSKDCLKSELWVRFLFLKFRHKNVSENQTFSSDFKHCLKYELFKNPTVIECLKSILVRISDTQLFLLNFFQELAWWAVCPSIPNQFKKLHCLNLHNQFFSCSAKNKKTNINNSLLVWSTSFSFWNFQGFHKKKKKRSQNSDLQLIKFCHCYSNVKTKISRYIFIILIEILPQTFARLEQIVILNCGEVQELLDRSKIFFFGSSL